MGNMQMEERGITLITLIISVVIILILASVSISIIVDGEGIFSEVRSVAETYKNIVRNEEEQVQGILNEIEEFLNVMSPDEVANIGDFVNYSVEVDGVIYDKWRILHFDTNGHMEIVCYNAPNYTLSGKDDYVKCIYLLNMESQAYKNGMYGYRARHLGCDPINPNNYEIISTDYVKYYSDYSTISSNVNYPYINQTHHITDTDVLETFSGSNKLSGTYSWLASRCVIPGNGFSIFRAYIVSSEGSVNNCNLCVAYSNDNEVEKGHNYQGMVVK